MNELIHRVLDAQRRKPAKHDWVTAVEQDLIDFNIKLSFEEISVMSKDKMKETVKSAMESAAFEFLIHEKNKKSKMANLIILL